METGRLKKALLVFVFFIGTWSSASAASNSEQPLEITADDTLEWHRNNQQYIARGNALAKQGSVSIQADILAADYRESTYSDFEIYRLTASGSVVITSDGNTVHGDKASYDVDKGFAIMTGEDLKMVSPQQTLTAEESFEYYVEKGELNAIGDAYVVRGEDTIKADRMKALFRQRADGTRELKQLEALGNVVIITATEVLKGERGVYKADTNIAELIGNVEIARGPNILEGERAEVNLNTNVSRMFGGATPGSRVSGTFYPGSEKPAPRDAYAAKGAIKKPAD